MVAFHQTLPSSIPSPPRSSSLFRVVKKKRKETGTEINGDGNRNDAAQRDAAAIFNGDASRVSVAPSAALAAAAAAAACSAG